jgi:thymidine kinase
MSSDDFPQKTSIGFLHIIFGCMFSMKTSKMVEILTNYSTIANVNPLIVNHVLDNRDITNKISTHNPLFKGLPSNIHIVSAKKLSEVNVSKYNVIGIDEMQFFEDLFETVLKWVSEGKHIIAAGLNGTAKKELFGDVYKLIPHVDKLDYCTAICSICVAEHDTSKILTPEILNTMKGSFSKKIAGDENLEVDVGSEDKYIPVCRKHFEN